MIRLRRWLTLVAMCSVAIVGLLNIWIFFVRPKVRYKEVLLKYPAGTAAYTILGDYPGKLQLQASGVILPSDAREDEKYTTALYHIYLPDADAEVFLNYDKKVLRIEKRRDLNKPK